MEEETLTPEEALTRATDLRREYLDLLKSPAWVRLVKIIDAQAESRLGDVLRPAPGFDALVVGEYEKGVRAGMLLLKQLPATIVEGLDIEIAELTQGSEDYE